MDDMDWLDHEQIKIIQARSRLDKRERFVDTLKNGPPPQKFQVGQTVYADDEPVKIDAYLGFDADDCDHHYLVSDYRGAHDVMYQHFLAEVPKLPWLLQK